MANGCVCRLCGWQEVEHMHGSSALGLSAEEIKERHVFLPGFTHVLYGEEPYFCPGYTPMTGEVRADRVAFVEEQRDIESGPLCINNMLA